MRDHPKSEFPDIRLRNLLEAWAREAKVICLGIGGLLDRSIRAYQIIIP